jgi:hypothetical protein
MNSNIEISAFSGSVAYMEASQNVIFNSCIFKNIASYDSGGVFYLSLESVMSLNSKTSFTNTQSISSSGGVFYVSSSELTIDGSNG